MIIAKSGVPITENMGFQWTGVQDPSSGAWEVDFPDAGGRVDGVSIAPISDSSPSDESIFTLRHGYPQYVFVTSSITAGDDLTSAGDGRYKIAGVGDLVTAKALANDISGILVVAVLWPPGA